MEGFGTLAQLVEQRTFNPLVGGSSPPRPTSYRRILIIKIKGLASASPFSYVLGFAILSNKSTFLSNALDKILMTAVLGAKKECRHWRA